MKKTNLFVFDGQSEKLLSVFSNRDNEQCPYYTADIDEQLNKDFLFEFSVPADHEDAAHVQKGNLVAFLDNDGDFQLFQIYKTEEIHNENGIEVVAYTEHAIYEIIDDIVEDRRVIEGSAEEAMRKALEASRWEVGVVDPTFGKGTVNFYYSNGIENLEKVTDRFGGELKYRVTLNADRTAIEGRFVDLLQRRGADTGNRLEFTKNLTEVKRTVESSGLKTALYGRGKGEEIEETGGYSRKVTFRDIVWRVIDGDPVDKPAGQEWVGSPTALAQYGRENGTRHRFGTVDFETTDPEELLQLTWEQLQQVSVPYVTYELSVVDLENLTGYSHEKVRLGDTVFVIDRDLGMRIEARVLQIKRSLVNPEETEVVLGNFIEDITDYNAKIDQIEAKITDRQGIWDKVEDIKIEDIDDDQLINITPDPPAEVSAEGLFKSIILKWTYEPSVRVAGYELYGSRVKGFTPDPTNLLFSGKSGGFTVNADTNETWYFRVRAVNPHGVTSAFTQEFSASTARIGLLDLEEATKQEFYGYTDSEVSEARKTLLTEIGEKADLTYVDGKLVHKADKETLEAVSGRVEIVEKDIVDIEGELTSKISQTVYETDMNGVVQRFIQNETTLSQHSKALNSKVEKSLFDTLSGKVSDAETNIAQNAEKIDLKAEKTVVEGIDGRLSEAEGSITLMSEEIELKVGKDGVIAAINVSPELIKLDANKIDLRGDVSIVNGQTTIGSAKIKSGMIDHAQIQNVHIVDGTIQSAKIHSLSADKITFGTLDGTKANIVNLNANNINAGRLKAQYVEIGSTTTFASGYDPSTKATPAQVTAAREYAEEKAAEAESAAKTYAETKAEYERTVAEAYADGLVSEEEKARIQADLDKLGEAKTYADTKKQEAMSAAQGYASTAQRNAVDYSKPVLKQFYDHDFTEGQKFWSTSYTGETVPSTTLGTTAKSSEALSGQIWTLQGQRFLFSTTPIPINPNRIYRVSFRVRQTVDATTAGTSRVYAGVATLNENFQAITGGAGSHRYCAAIGKSIVVEDGWQEFSGIITGEGDTHNEFRPGTKFVRPMFIVNYSGGNGTVEVDFLNFEDITEIQEIENRVTEVELLTTDDSIISTVTNSATYQADLENKVDQYYVDDNFVTNDDLASAEENIHATTDQKIADLQVPALAQRVSEVEQTAEQIDFKFTNSGGVNLLRNSVGYAGESFWVRASGHVRTLQNLELAQIGAGSGWYSPVGETMNLVQKVSVVNSSRYTISFQMRKSVDSTAGNAWAGVGVYLDGVQVKFVGLSSGAGTTDGFEKFTYNIDTDLGEVEFRILVGSNAEAIITNLMVNIGDVPLQWTLASGEVYNTNVLMDMNGVRVLSDQYAGYTAITPQEFSGYAEVIDEATNQREMKRVFTLNRDTTEVAKVQVEQEVRMSPLKIIPVTSGGFNGWAFVPED